MADQNKGQETIGKPLLGELSKSSQFGGQHGFRAQHSGRVIFDVVMAFDFFVITLGAIAAEWIYILSYLQSGTSSPVYLITGLLGAFFAVVAMRRQGVYSLSTLSQLRGQGSPIILGLAIAFVILLGAGYTLKISAMFSRGWVALWFIFSILFLLGHHFVVARILRRWAASGFFARNIAIYGSGEITQKLIEHFGNNFQRSRILGVYDDLDGGVTPKVPVAGGLSDLIREGQTSRIDEIVIALPLAQGSRITHLVTQLAMLPSNIRLCPDLVAFSLHPVGLVHDDGLAVLELVRAPMGNWAPVLKMLEDKTLSALALLLLSPVMLAVALAIKLDSRGPVFFQQRRHGFNHQIISVMKFRTMNVVEDGVDVPQARRDDPRITRVGKILRRTSLDELPQLINVLRGNMSLVGPRPHALAHNAYYTALLETYAARHKVKPGITGWAQVNGFRGETDTPEKMRRRVEHDLYYIENWSIWLDIKILLMTPIYGLFGKNAF